MPRKLIDAASLSVRDLWLHDDTCAGRPVRAVLVEDIEKAEAVVLCEDCYLHGHCIAEIAYNTARMPDSKMFCAVGKKKSDNAEYCICCGEVIPEGRQVCPYCEREDKYV